jgi:hypothetical protein
MSGNNMDFYQPMAIGTSLDVCLTPPVNNGDLLVYDSVGACWENQAPAMGTDVLVKVTAADTTSGFLNDKIVGGTNITTTVLNPAGNEDLRINWSANIADLNDVTITSVANAQSLIFRSPDWVNERNKLYQEVLVTLNQTVNMAVWTVYTVSTSSGSPTLLFPTVGLVFGDQIFIYVESLTAGNFIIIDADGNSLINPFTHAIDPDYQITCNFLGQYNGLIIGYKWIGSLWLLETYNPRDFSQLGNFKWNVAGDTPAIGDLMQITATPFAEFKYKGLGELGLTSTHVSGVVPTTRTITGGVGIAAMGDLSADRTVTLDLNELAIVTAVATDYVSIVDVTDNSTKRALISDITSISSKTYGEIFITTMQTYATSTDAWFQTNNYTSGLATSGITLLSDGIQNTSGSTKIFKCDFTVSVDVAGGTRDIRWIFAINGTTATHPALPSGSIAKSEMARTVSSGNPGSIATSAIVSLANNDIIQIWIVNTESNDDIIHKYAHFNIIEI